MGGGGDGLCVCVFFYFVIHSFRRSCYSEALRGIHRKCSSASIHGLAITVCRCIAPKKQYILIPITSFQCRFSFPRHNKYILHYLPTTAFVK